MTRLLPALFAELYQTEYSAYRHPIREARRLGEVPPAVALRAIAAHANEVLDELPRLGRTRGLRVTSVGAAAVEALWTVRHAIAFRFMDAERSYRAVLLDLRRSVDLVHVLRALAAEESDDRLVAWCDRWLSTREWLVREAADELDWFGHHPEFAARPVVRARDVAQAAGLPSALGMKLGI